jgi:hypothetical protein
LEGLSVYERSKKELDQIRASLSSNTVTIDMLKLDNETKGVIIEALRKAINSRYPDVMSVITGVNK